MKSHSPGNHSQFHVPLTSGEKKVFGFLLGLFFLGLAVLGLKSWLTPDSRLWVEPALRQTTAHLQAKSYPVFAPKSIPPLASLDLNRVGEKELTGVPSVGPVLAKRILDYRKSQGTFQNLSQLREVPGIGEKRYSQIAPYFFIRPIE